MPHPHIVENGDYKTRGERIQQLLTDERRKMRKLREKHTGLKNERDELREGAKFWNNNGSKADEKTEEMQELFEKIMRLAVYMAQRVLHALGVVKNPPDARQILTNAQRKDIEEHYKTDELSRAMAGIESKQKEGIYNAVRQRMEAEQLMLLKWESRPEKQEAEAETRKINVFSDLSKKHLSEQAQEAVQGLIERNDINGVLKRLAHENMLKMQEAKAKDAKQEQEATQEQGKPAKRTPATFGLG
ncbi:hypothetical protein [Neokomagataea anthophila]|uniref:Uncharacterized protein n=1 Tax=Neokomagataea anthophila TaxID=2826925 RepID=A0ABS5E764_9PROT|nr:hypothetical protein [Neokomagataea anthophila]MBR0559745.1 hypothetical protein [Neokomagataea anthophila]